MARLRVLTRKNTPAKAQFAPLIGLVNFIQLLAGTPLNLLNSIVFGPINALIGTTNGAINLIGTLSINLNAALGLLRTLLTFGP